MTTATITIGTIAALASLVCWALFFGGVWRMIRTIAQGQKDTTRIFPIWPRFKQMIDRVHRSHAHGQIPYGRLGALAGDGRLPPRRTAAGSRPTARRSIPSSTGRCSATCVACHLMDEILGLGTVIGILVLIAIRQLNHPRVPERLSRFSGSKFGAAYFVEIVVLLEGLGMIFVKAGKIATYGTRERRDRLLHDAGRQAAACERDHGLDLRVHQADVRHDLARCLVGRNINWGVAWHRFSAFFNIYFKREDDGGVAPRCRQADDVDGQGPRHGERRPRHRHPRRRQDRGLLAGRAGSTSPPAPSAVVARASARHGTPVSRSRPSC